MLRTSIFALLASTALLSAQDDKAVADAIAKVNASGASLAPISAEGKTYRFTALNVAREFTDAGLAPLAPIADKVVSLDIARSKVTDAGLKAVAAMKKRGIAPTPLPPAPPPGPGAARSVRVLYSTELRFHFES